MKIVISPEIELISIEIIDGKYHILIDSKELDKDEEDVICKRVTDAFENQ